MLYSMAVLATTLGCEHQWMLTGWVSSCTRDRVAHVLLNTGFTKATVASGGEASYPNTPKQVLGQSWCSGHQFVLSQKQQHGPKPPTQLSGCDWPNPACFNEKNRLYPD